MIRPKHHAEFVLRMEEILAVYQRAYDSQHPVICLDEKPYQLIGQTRQRILKKDGSIQEDYEYVRKGVTQLYMCFEPLSGQRFVQVRDSHNRFDWVKVVSDLLDGPYQQATQITLVEDNHSSHKPAAFYEVYPPEIAAQYLNRIHFVYTPAHGSWLNMAEIELGVLTKQVLGQRIDQKEELGKQIEQWQKNRNQKEVKANWQFTTQDARIKLKSLYPTL